MSIFGCTQYNKKRQQLSCLMVSFYTVSNYYTILYSLVRYRFMYWNQISQMYKETKLNFNETLHMVI